jgi:hypothetical protein
MEQDPIASRDAGLRRVSRLTRLAVAGGLALTGVFSAIAARAFSGHSTAQAATTATTAATTDTTATTAPQSSVSSQSSSSQSSATSTTQLQAPSTAVRSSSGSSHVRSGGS